jgi:hypothetical protein
MWSEQDQLAAAMATSDYYEIVKRAARGGRERAVSVATTPGQVSVRFGYTWR